MPFGKRQVLTLNLPLCCSSSSSSLVEVVGVDPLDCVARSHRDTNVEVDHEAGQLLPVDENHLCVNLTNVRSRVIPPKNQRSQK
jgi:hypothetical protein